MFKLYILTGDKLSYVVKGYDVESLKTEAYMTKLLFPQLNMVICDNTQEIWFS